MYHLHVTGYPSPGVVRSLLKSTQSFMVPAKATTWESSRFHNPAPARRKGSQCFVIPTYCRDSEVEIISWFPHFEEMAAGILTKWYWISIPFMTYHYSIFQRKLTWGASISCVFSYIQNTDNRVWCCNGQSEIDTGWKEKQKAKTCAKISRSKKLYPITPLRKLPFKASLLDSTCQNMRNIQKASKSKTII